MSESKPAPSPSPEKSKSSTKKALRETIVIRMWPKTPALYPMAIAALILGIFSISFGSISHVEKLIESQDELAVGAPAAIEIEEEVPERSAFSFITDLRDKILPDRALPGSAQLQAGYEIDRILTWIFIGMAVFSLFTLCIDFEVHWFLLLIALVVVATLGCYILDQHVPFVKDAIAIADSVRPIVNPAFYFCIFAIWLLLMIVSLIVVRFQYVRIEANEVLVVGGLMEKQKRYSTFRMHYTKEIQDVLEYWLPFVRSGRLVLHFPGEEQPVIIDNVIHIDGVIKRLDILSSALKVEQRT